MDQLLTELCGQVSSQIQEKMRDALNDVQAKVMSGVNNNSPFKVTGSNGDYTVYLKENIK